MTTKAPFKQVQPSKPKEEVKEVETSVEVKEEVKEDTISKDEVLESTSLQNEIIPIKDEILDTETSNIKELLKIAKENEIIGTTETSNIKELLKIAKENEIIGTTETNTILKDGNFPNTSKEQPILTNKELAVQRLIASVGLDVYNNSHLKSLIDKDGDIDEIEANWLVIGTKQYDETNPEQAEERFNEFKMYSGE